MKGMIFICKLGDIIVVNQFKDYNGTIVPKHSFVVIDDKHGVIEGFSYDFISNIMCSFHSEKHKKHKLKIKSNVEINNNQVIGKNINHKGGYIRTDELFYFDKSKIQYKVIARVQDELLNKLIRLSNIYKKTNHKDTINNLC